MAQHAVSMDTSSSEAVEAGFCHPLCPVFNNDKAVLALSLLPPHKILIPEIVAAKTNMAENDKSDELYVGEIKGGVKPTMRLVIMGIFKKQPKSMVVALACQPQDDAEGDVGLQVTVSFPDRAVIRNARLAGKWGPSESALSYFPFAAGEPFKMEIVCEHQQFRLLVDGQPLCGFSHRLLHLASLTTLRIGGDLQLTKVA